MSVTFFLILLGFFFLKHTAILLGFFVLNVVLLFGNKREFPIPKYNNLFPHVNKINVWRIHNRHINYLKYFILVQN